MRAVLALLIVAILLVVAAIVSGYVNVRQIRGSTPAITATRNSVSASGGQAPAFDVETGSVKVGTKETTVKVPVLKVQKPGAYEAAPVSNNAM